MLFGSTQQFGIELDTDANSGGHWILGRVCYWICGDRVGDYELGTSLRDVLFRLERILHDKGNRSNYYLMPLNTVTLVNTLHDSMFGNSSPDEAVERRAIEEQWARHDINPHIDVFDKWKIFLVESDKVARCVYCTPVNICHECLLSIGEFDLILDDAVSQLHQYLNIHV